MSKQECRDTFPKSLRDMCIKVGANNEKEWRKQIGNKIFNMGHNDKKENPPPELPQLERKWKN